MVVIAILTVNLRRGIFLLDKSGDYLVEKKVRGGGKQVICSNEECDYKESVVK